MHLAEGGRGEGFLSQENHKMPSWWDQEWTPNPGGWWLIRSSLIKKLNSGSQKLGLSDESLDVPSNE